nr:unnamed protein product [Callosobruchus chinensis]
MACPSPQFSEPGDISYLQRQGKRRSWHVHPNQVSPIVVLYTSLLYSSLRMLPKSLFIYLKGF